MKVIKINAIWCSACIIMNNVWGKVENKYNIETINLDYDFDNEEVLKYDPGNILPVFIFMDKDLELGRIVGEISYQKMIDYIEEIGGNNEENN